MTVGPAGPPARRAGHTGPARLTLPLGMHGLGRLLVLVAGRGPSGGTHGPRFVCPFCGRSFADPMDRCDRCGGRPIVDADEQGVYRRVVALCGPRYDPMER